MVVILPVPVQPTLVVMVSEQPVIVLLSDVEIVEQYFVV